MSSKRWQDAIDAENEAVERRARESDIQDARDAAMLAIDTSYNGDETEKAWTEEWLLKAWRANKTEGEA